MIIFKAREGSVARVTQTLTGSLQRPEQLTNVLAAALLRSARRNFEAGGRPLPWLPSQGSREGGRVLIQSGRLMNSLRRRHNAREATVYSRDVRARIHELGGTIVPRRAKALTIPLCPEARRKRATEFDRKKTFLLKRPGKDPVIMLKGEEGGQATALYVLKKSVRIPARPFLRPPEDELREMIELTRQFVVGRTT
jgi:phage gpG-like protein